MTLPTNNNDAPATGRPVAVVTGASSGIGAATATHLAAAGFDVVVGARRTDRLDQLVAQIGQSTPAATVTAHSLDVTDDASVEAFAQSLNRVDVLINNAGGALGTDSVENANLDHWQRMYDVNVLGVLRITKALLPALRQSECATVLTIGSIAAVEPYIGGAGYNAAKHAVRALTRVLRLELLGEPIRVSEVDPGLVETEFSINRFDGDADRAAQVYEGLDPMTADDIAEIIAFVCTRPPHVNIDSLLVLCRDQTSAQRVHRRGEKS